MSRLREVAIGVGVALAVFGVDALRTEATQRLHKVKEQNDVYALPPPKLVRVLTLGHTDAAASILWASTLYQYGEHLGQNRRFQYSTQYLETILELDPGFRPAYRFLSTLVTMQAANPMPIEIDRTDKLFARGAELYPEDAGILGAYAAFLLFEGAQFLPPRRRRPSGCAARRSPSAPSSSATSWTPSTSRVRATSRRPAPRGSPSRSSSAPTRWPPTTTSASGSRRGSASCRATRPSSARSGRCRASSRRGGARRRS
ncbi:MAG: hypothetical protein IPJ34_34735 [Myxococcales bacterium]|nr:hypothetical protein [Myxococcales bacterium]